jgi:hypothetical protein
MTAKKPQKFRLYLDDGPFCEAYLNLFWGVEHGLPWDEYPEIQREDGEIDPLLPLEV